ncbi:Postreplication repair E3 ubiquitin-protein ligase rad18 [Cytospora mali]|uniref:Postreplication repair E3 ubiquitin-protein ligase RAD18 n=1 Tax=Cytospora mali TaxID=578113 RepID=A0A194UU05_CYTMA|nr:Postreplication repair E3 ubiquitin-protein ligase rad18 [Valsa mali var. pyri (nom. inval.)]
MDARITGPITKDDAYDVSDPTDWLGTPLASLMPVEQSLRCHVCKDFFTSPMVTSCCHTFCSLCIRRALAVDGKCPLCRATDQESRLRGNWAIREAAEHFVKARDAMLKLAREPPAALTVAPASTSKRKAADEAVNGGKRTRMSTRSSSARSAEATAAMMREEVDIPEADAEEVEEYIADDGLVACPICQWRMKPERVDRHLDTNCPGEPRPQPKSPSKPQRFGFTTAQSIDGKSSKMQERLPSLNYSLVKDNALKKRLSDLGISSWGPRQLLEKRHKEWVMIWNANCDSSRPKSKTELLRDLDTWERTQGGHASMTSQSASLGAQIKDKEFDGAGWSAKHSDSFKDLIANARMSHQKAEQKPQEPSSTEGHHPLDVPLNNTSHEILPEVMTNGDAQSQSRPVTSSATLIDLTIPASQPPDNSPQKTLAGRSTSLLAEDTVVDSSLAGTTSS